MKQVDEYVSCTSTAPVSGFHLLIEHSWKREAICTDKI